MRFVRRLLVVCAVAALVVGLGVAWSHSGAAGLVADDHGGGRAPAGAAPAGSPPPRGGGGFDRRGTQPWSITDVSDLVQTLVLLGGIVAAVVVVDKTRRRRRPVVPRRTDRTLDAGTAG